MKYCLSIGALVFALVAPLLAQNPAANGIVSGRVIDGALGKPVEYATITVREKISRKTVGSGVTDANGAFDVAAIPSGDFDLTYALVGAAREVTVSFSVDPSHREVRLGRLELAGATAVQMDRVEVAVRKETFDNSIDRKVYNVGKELQSVAGTASNLLQNVPSVQVDIEGNVSLRGDANVLILVNGKTSTMMGKNRAAVLEQMPADGIEKIEVITNPSAKYKPDGTAGIINLTLKKKQAAGYSGSVGTAVGNNGRYNVNVSANYNPGKFNAFVTASVRQDDRPRTVVDNRSHVDTATNSLVSTSQYTVESSRPFSRIGQTGVDYKFDDHNKLGGNVRYNFRDFVRVASVINTSRDAAGTVTEEYERRRKDLEWEKDLEFTATFQHAFAQPDREFNVEVRRGKTTEQEDNRYTNEFRSPAGRTTFDFTLIRNTEITTETSADYSHPLGEDSKLETGYNGQLSETDLNFRGSYLDAVGATQTDAARTNHFIYNAAIHAFYGTFARKFGSVGLLAGLRFEHAGIDTNQVTARLPGTNTYNRLYPSVHLAYNLTETDQVQLNYSHRVRRPEGDDLNPYPEYQDPFNLRAGNPRLVPEDIHSVEAGWQHRKDETTYLATAYYRYRYQGMTEVTRYIDRTTLLTTKENLGISRAGGVEIGANTRIRDRLSLNLSANAYRAEIDASNLGFSARRTSFAWDAKLNTTFDVTPTTMLQFNANYTAKRLTPQGYRFPTKVANLGFRKNFNAKRTALIVTVADIFGSLRERTHIDTPVLREDTIRRRSSRIIYVGFVYNFGKAAKKSKKDDLLFDNAL